MESNPIPPDRAVHVVNKEASQLSIDDLVNETTPTGTTGGCALIEAVIGEPYFATSLLPWHNLHFWYVIDALRQVCASDCVIVPSSADLMAVAGMVQCIIHSNSCTVCLHQIHYLLSVYM